MSRSRQPQRGSPGGLGRLDDLVQACEDKRRLADAIARKDRALWQVSLDVEAAHVSDYGVALTALVAREVAALRQKRGWSLEELADRADLHRTTLGLVERGRRGLTLDSAARLARALDLPLSELVRLAEQRLAGGAEADATTRPTAPPQA